MASIREQILATMIAGLESIPGPVVARDAALPEKVPVGGLFILRDNGEVPQAAFSGADQYELRVTIELFADTTDATTGLDALRTAAITTFLADRTVGGLAVDVREGPTSELDPLHEVQRRSRPASSSSSSITGPPKAIPTGSLPEENNHGQRQPPASRSGAGQGRHVFRAGAGRGAPRNATGPR
jgi:hypothetical protein